MLHQLSLDVAFQLLLIVQPLTQMLMLGLQTKHEHAEVQYKAIQRKTEAVYIFT